MPKNIVVMSDGTGQVGGKGHDTLIGGAKNDDEKRPALQRALGK